MWRNAAHTESIRRKRNAHSDENSIPIENERNAKRLRHVSVFRLCGPIESLPIGILNKPYLNVFAVEYFDSTTIKTEMIRPLNKTRSNELSPMAIQISAK